MAGAGDLRDAIVAEFASTYSRHGTLTEDDFDLGFGVGPAPGSESPAQREPIVDRIMLSGSFDEGLRQLGRTHRAYGRAPLDWSNLTSAWPLP